MAKPRLRPGAPVLRAFPEPLKGPSVVPPGSRAREVQDAKAPLGVPVPELRASCVEPDSSGRRLLYSKSALIDGTEVREGVGDALLRGLPEEILRRRIVLLRSETGEIHHAEAVLRIGVPLRRGALEEPQRLRVIGFPAGAEEVNHAKVRLRLGEPAKGGLPEPLLGLRAVPADAPPGKVHDPKV